jgi:hypothetical protein
MPRPRYYRRQSDLCLQLAMLQTDPQTKLLLVELAKDLQAKADDPEGVPRRSLAAFPGRSAAPLGGALQTRDRSRF